MNRQALLKLAASAIVVALGTSGCSGLDLSRLAPASSEAALARSGNQWGAKADALMAKGKTAQAIVAAENAVAANPDVALHRARLGQFYLAAGRFGSAETALADAVALGDVSGRTYVSLSLAQTANGKAHEAVVLLSDHRDVIAAADYGLALALAGDVERGVMALTEAARSEGADARTRQNLAFAYAIAGRWLEAKVLASQDMNIAQLDQRMIEWATIAQAPQPQIRVAGLLRVTPSADAGLPVRLALVDAPDAQVALAAEAVAEIAAVEPATVAVPVEAAPAQPAPAQPVDMAAVEAASTLFEPAFVAEQEAPAPVPFVQAVAVAAPAAIRSVPAPRTTGGSPWVVQLGAFATNAAASSAWSLYARRFANLNTTDGESHSAVVGGRTVYRLSANGYASQREADSACATVRAKGGSCFVRKLDGNDKVRWSSRTGATKLAAR